MAPGAGRSERGAAHCHHRMRQEMRRLIATTRPAAVQIEFSELAGLSDLRSGSVPWSITLHDVNLGLDGAPGDDAREMESLSRFDRVFVCSYDDAALVPQLKPVVVPNGMEEMEYIPSGERGARDPVCRAFPLQAQLRRDRRLRPSCLPGFAARVPDTELWILAGAGASERPPGELEDISDAGHHPV